uniref:Uncharacterized protein n=1 Tax=Oryza meridionalis TaxID=40149 RepID=A0A0E0CEX6_9ORYZ
MNRIELLILLVFVVYKITHRSAGLEYWGGCRAPAHEKPELLLLVLVRQWSHSPLALLLLLLLLSNSFIHSFMQREGSCNFSGGIGNLLQGWVGCGGASLWEIILRDCVLFFCSGAVMDSVSVLAVQLCRRCSPVISAACVSAAFSDPCKVTCTPVFSCFLV